VGETHRFYNIGDREVINMEAEFEKNPASFLDP